MLDDVCNAVPCFSNVFSAITRETCLRYVHRYISKRDNWTSRSNRIRISKQEFKRYYVHVRVD